MLGERLKECAYNIENAICVCDVGTDHAYLACELVKSGKTKRAIASDVRKGPLENARANVEKYGLSDKISLCLSDGLENISSCENFINPDYIVIAGMGAENIISILENDLEKDCYSQNATLILQPMTRMHLLRKWLCLHGYTTTEKAVRESGKLYTVMKSIKDRESLELSEAEYYMGFFDYKNKLNFEYGNFLIKKIERIKNGAASDNEELAEKIAVFLDETREILNAQG